jgi:hypothetical protein
MLTPLSLQSNPYASNLSLFVKMKQPNDEDPLNHEAAAVLRENPKLFESNVRRAMSGGYVGQAYFPRYFLYIFKSKPTGLMSATKWQMCFFEQPDLFGSWVLFENIVKYICALLADVFYCHDVYYFFWSLLLKFEVHSNQMSLCCHTWDVECSYTYL